MDRWKTEMGRVREKRRVEERRSEKRKSQKKEDAGARKGRKVAKHCVFPMICGASWPDERWKIARRCGAKHISKSKCTRHHMFGPLLEVMMSKKCTPLWREAHFEVKLLKTPGFGPFLDVQMSFRVAGARDCRPCQKWAKKREGFVACPKTMTGAGHLKRICKDEFSVAGAVQETSSSELLGGPGTDFVRGVTFWSLRSSGLLSWFCVTGAAFRMTWHHFFVAGAVL